MVSVIVTYLTVTFIWLCVGGIGPFLVPKSPFRGVYQTMLILTAVCCWLHWFITILSQMNPLIGPDLKTGVIRMLQWTWEA